MTTRRKFVKTAGATAATAALEGQAKLPAGAPVAVADVPTSAWSPPMATVAATACHAGSTPTATPQTTIPSPWFLTCFIWRGWGSEVSGRFAPQRR